MIRASARRWNTSRRDVSRSRLLIVTAILIGLTIGVGYTFVYAKGYSYLSNDPQTCANCHVMRDHFNAWTRSSHRAIAVCNDCHTPPGTIPKYMTKAQNGFWHSFYFTTGRYPDPLRITPRNHEVTELTCRKCHTELTSSIDPFHTNTGRGGLTCTATAGPRTICVGGCRRSKIEPSRSAMSRRTH